MEPYRPGDGCFAPNADTHSTWKVEFKHGVFIPKSTGSIGDGGVIKLTNNVCNVPTWCGHGSCFIYKEEDDLW